MAFPPFIIFLDILPAVERPIAGSMLRRAGAFQLDCDCVRQPLLVASCPLHENAGSRGGPIQIPPGWYGVGVAQLLGQGTTAVTDLTRDFVPSLPTICGNRALLTRRSYNLLVPLRRVTIAGELPVPSSIRRGGSAF